MWPFFRARSVAQCTAPLLSSDVLEDGILSTACGGVRMAALYATMLGFKHEVPTHPQTVSEFINLIQSEPEFTSEGVLRATRRVIHDANIMWQSNSFDALIKGHVGKENIHLTPYLGVFQKAVNKFGLEQIVSQARFDLPAFIQRTAVERRAIDIDIILKTLDEYQGSLAPSLVQARIRGTKSYGHLGYAEFYSELMDFLRGHFNEENLPFFQSLYPIKICLEHIEPWIVVTKKMS